jgi:hypothetical protein
VWPLLVLGLANTSNAKAACGHLPAKVADVF